MTGFGAARITDGVAGQQTFSAPAAARTVLVVGDDSRPLSSKIARHLGRALQRLGHGAAVRDTRLIRWAGGEIPPDNGVRREAYETAVVVKWRRLLEDYGFDTVITLDADWLLSSRLFLEAEGVREIHSFWQSGQVRRLQQAPLFSSASKTLLEVGNNPKLKHHSFGPEAREELRTAGVERIQVTRAAAPAEYLQASAPCGRRDRLAFFGGPGLGAALHQPAWAALEKGESLLEVRRIAREEILDSLKDKDDWGIRPGQPGRVRDLLAVASERRVRDSNPTAISLINEAGQAYPAALDFLRREDLLLEAAQLVHEVNRYDRVAAVMRLARRGWLEVHGQPELWKPFGVAALPPVPFSCLAPTYRQYVAHLALPEPTGEISLGETLFEAAACARASIGLRHEEARDSFPEALIPRVDSWEELEAAAERILADPDMALALGEKMREHVARADLWDHRLEKALA